MTALDVGFDVPAAVGMTVPEIQTPALVVDLDAFDRNVERMRAFTEATGMRLRAHAKTHKSADIGLLQMARGGACGVCCQKVSEAEALVRSGITDVLVSNEVVGAARIARLAALAGKARVLVCVDDAQNARDLSAACEAAGTTLEVLVEIDCGSGRCGVHPGPAAVSLARVVSELPGLTFAGLQAYHGAAQHIPAPAARRAATEEAVRLTKLTVDQLREAGFECDIVGGGGTGSHAVEAGSGVYNELQCGSYVFMDRDYGRIPASAKSDAAVGGFEHALFVLSTVMSAPTAGRRVCDAGLKASSVDSGLPGVWAGPEAAGSAAGPSAEHASVEYEAASDEHGTLSDPEGCLALGDHVWLIPGHCDPTVNLYDWYVGVRGLGTAAETESGTGAGAGTGTGAAGKGGDGGSGSGEMGAEARVECLWPVTARGKLY